jgi:drug/metabolite transporter (DMT)-like permease
MGFLNFGLRETTAARAALLMASNPIVVAILSAVILREFFSGRSILGILIAVCGVVMSIGSGALTQGGGIGRGEMLVACASLCWAVSTIVAKRIGSKFDPFDLTFWQMLFGSILLCGIAFASTQPFSMPHTSNCWLALLWLAIPASTGAMGTWFAALSIGGAVRTSGFLFLCPVFSAAISFFLEGETIFEHEVSGAMLVGIGLLILSGRTVKLFQSRAGGN